MDGLRISTKYDLRLVQRQRMMLGSDLVPNWKTSAKPEPVSCRTEAEPQV